MGGFVGVDFLNGILSQETEIRTKPNYGLG